MITRPVENCPVYQKNYQLSVFFFSVDVNERPILTSLQKFPQFPPLSVCCCYETHFLFLEKKNGNQYSKNQKLVCYKTGQSYGRCLMYCRRYLQLNSVSNLKKMRRRKNLESMHLAPRGMLRKKILR